MRGAGATAISDNSFSALSVDYLSLNYQPPRDNSVTVSILIRSAVVT
jgi:hypothetical protein